MSARPDDAASGTALAGIEALAEEYALARQRLYERILALELEVDRLKRAALPAMRDDVGAAIALRDRLKAEIEAHAECFARPRTAVLHGIRVGFAQAKPAVEIDDEAATIARIRERLPKDQAELLIRVRESVHKPAVYDLDDATLRRIGIRVAGGNDQVVIKPQDGAVAKLVDALLASGDQLEDV